MSAASFEAITGSWYPSHQELIKRPRYNGAFAIDPKNAHEIDDAIYVTMDRDRLGFQAQIHIADGGLLADTDLIAGARDKGWSRYFADGETDLMLPPETKRLDLTAISKVGVPAVTIGFGFSKSGGIGDVTLDKSRVRVDGISYAAFLRRYNKNDARAHDTASAAQMLATHTDLSAFSRERFSEDVVGRFMVIANFIVAGEMEDAGVPWLFRTNTKDAYTRWGNPYERQKFEEMRVALYGATALQHEGLGLKRYCHFTSPLRRFADLANHLNLSAYMQGKEPPYTYLDIDDLAHELTELYVRRSNQFNESAA